MGIALDFIDASLTQEKSLLLFRRFHPYIQKYLNYYWSKNTKYNINYLYIYCFKIEIAIANILRTIVLIHCIFSLRAYAERNNRLKYV